jgi:hypothetical protein
MLRQTLHSAVAAIAVSMMCLPVADAEAKEDLVLDFGTANVQAVGRSVPGTGYLFADGVMMFGSKTLEFHDAWMGFADDIVWGQHTVCDAQHSAFVPYESSILLRGSNGSNTLLMQTQFKEYSKDLANNMASGLCLELLEGEAYEFSADLRVNWQIGESTGKWSCAYLIEPSLFGERDGVTVVNRERITVDRNLNFADEPWIATGTVVIPRSEC